MANLPIGKISVLDPQIVYTGCGDAPASGADRHLAQELVDQGIAAESSAKTTEAMQCYRRAIVADPGFAPAHINLAIALHAKGELAAAIASYRLAIALDPNSAAAHYNLALVYLETGEAALAESEFREALRLRGNFPEAYVGLADALEALVRNDDALAALDTAILQREGYLGAQFNASRLLLKLGKLEAAEKRLREIDLRVLLFSADRHAELESVARQLVQVWPNYETGWKALGTVLALQQRFEEALQPLQQALIWLPSDPEIHNNLGATFQALGRLIEAEGSYIRALELKPDYHEAHNNLGKVRVALGRSIDAEADFRRALQIKPDYCEAHNNLADVLQSLGRSTEAEQVYLQVLELEPDSHQTHNNLGVALLTLGRLSESEANFRRALELSPGYQEAHNNLGNILQAMRRLSEAEDSYHCALGLRPDSPVTHSNLGSVLRELGRVDEAEASFRRAIELDPGYHEAHSNLLFTLNCTARLSRAELFQEHRSWAHRHEAPLVAQRTIHGNSRNRHRQLRIGYVSPDFRRHSVAYFIEPVLKGHDRASFEVYCYSNVVNPDAMTRRLLESADHAHNIVGMSDAQAAERIRADNIDILVDLAGHTARGRLGLFALKPAPVQVSFLGYPNTSGLDAIDWRLTDIHADPPGDGDEFYSERQARLPKTFLCFRPPQEAPEVVPPPYFRNGCVTFGSFNVLSKITPEVIRAWSQLLERVRRSRLLLKALGLSDLSARKRLLGEFARHGIGEDRLILLPADHDFETHLARYNEVDVGLDTFPYNGTTTTLEALWMGVPVVSLCGDRHVARIGADILVNLGLDALIAESISEYVTLAADLATDSSRLALLRQTMRARICASPLREEREFARELEKAYREMWNHWCGS